MLDVQYLQFGSYWWVLRWSIFCCFWWRHLVASRGGWRFNWLGAQIQDVNRRNFYWHLGVMRLNFQVCAHGLCAHWRSKLYYGHCTSPRWCFAPRRVSLTWALPLSTASVACPLSVTGALPQLWVGPALESVPKSLISLLEVWLLRTSRSNT